MVPHILRRNGDGEYERSGRGPAYRLYMELISRARDDLSGGDRGSAQRKLHEAKALAASWAPIPNEGFFAWTGHVELESTLAEIERDYPVPPGMRVRPGGFGCGDSVCTMCYEPVPADRLDLGVRTIVSVNLEEDDGQRNT